MDFPLEFPKMTQIRKLSHLKIGNQVPSIRVLYTSLTFSEFRHVQEAELNTFIYFVHIHSMCPLSYGSISSGHRGFFTWQDDPNLHPLQINIIIYPIWMICHGFSFDLFYGHQNIKIDSNNLLGIRHNFAYTYHESVT